MTKDETIRELKIKMVSHKMMAEHEPDISEGQRAFHRAAAAGIQAAVDVMEDDQ